MSEEIQTLPEVDLGDGRTVLTYEGGAFYRVRMPNGEVQAFPAKATATPENALDDIVTNPPEPVPSLPHRVLKDTIWMRVRDLGRRDAATAALAQLPLANKTDWDCQSWFWSDNLAIRQVLSDIGCTAEEVDVIMAADPLAP